MIDKIVRTIVNPDGSIASELVTELASAPPPLPPIAGVMTEDDVALEFVAALSEPDCGPSAIRAALNAAQSNATVRNAFLKTWVAHGLRLRQSVGDDALLLDMFRACASPYAGPDLHLYRGDSSGNVASSNFGFAWTSSPEWARMHAQRFALGPDPGVVLKAWAPARAIITKLDCSHMAEEQEYIVIPSELLGIEVIATVR